MAAVNNPPSASNQQNAPKPQTFSPAVSAPPPPSTIQSASSPIGATGYTGPGAIVGNKSTPSYGGFGAAATGGSSGGGTGGFNVGGGQNVTSSAVSGGSASSSVIAGGGSAIGAPVMVTQGGQQFQVVQTSPFNYNVGFTVLTNGVPTNIKEQVTVPTNSKQNNPGYAASIAYGDYQTNPSLKPFLGSLVSGSTNAQPKQISVLVSSNGQIAGQEIFNNNKIQSTTPYVFRFNPLNTNGNPNYVSIGGTTTNYVTKGNAVSTYGESNQNKAISAANQAANSGISIGFSGTGFFSPLSSQYNYQLVSQANQAAITGSIQGLQQKQGIASLQQYGKQVGGVIGTSIAIRTGETFKNSIFAPSSIFSSTNTPEYTATQSMYITSPKTAGGGVKTVVYTGLGALQNGVGSALGFTENVFSPVKSGSSSILGGIGGKVGGSSGNAAGSYLGLGIAGAVSFAYVEKYEYALLPSTYLSGLNLLYSAGTNPVGTAGQLVSNPYQLGQLLEGGREGVGGKVAFAPEILETHTPPVPDEEVEGGFSKNPYSYIGIGTRVGIKAYAVIGLKATPEGRGISIGLPELPTKAYGILGEADVSHNVRPIQSSLDVQIFGKALTSEAEASGSPTLLLKAQLFNQAVSATYDILNVEPPKQSTFTFKIDTLSPKEAEAISDLFKSKYGNNIVAKVKGNTLIVGGSTAVGVQLGDLFRPAGDLDVHNIPVKKLPGLTEDIKNTINNVGESKSIIKGNNVFKIVSGKEVRITDLHTPEDLESETNQYAKPFSGRKLGIAQSKPVKIEGSLFTRTGDILTDKVESALRPRLLAGKSEVDLIPLPHRVGKELPDAFALLERKAEFANPSLRAKATAKINIAESAAFKLGLVTREQIDIAKNNVGSIRGEPQSTPPETNQPFTSQFNPTGTFKGKKINISPRSSSPSSSLSSGRFSIESPSRSSPSSPSSFSFSSISNQSSQSRSSKSSPSRPSQPSSLSRSAPSKPSGFPSYSISSFRSSPIRPSRSSHYSPPPRRPPPIVPPPTPPKKTTPVAPINLEFNLGIFKNSQKAKPSQVRQTAYKPSLLGLISGKTIKSSQEGKQSNQFIRPPVARKGKGFSFLGL